MRPIDASDPEAREILGSLLAARGLPVTAEDVTAAQESLLRMRDKVTAVRSTPLPYLEPVIEPLSGLQWLAGASGGVSPEAAGATRWPDEDQTRSNDLTEMTAGELLGMYARGDTSPVEVLAACRSQIQEHDCDVDAVVTLLDEDAHRAARDAERRWRSGEARALEGVPFGVKDIIATAGVRTTGGSRIYAEYVPEVTGAAVARLQDSGAVMLAKLHTYEFASSQRCKGNGGNPWDLTRTPGGSSEGSAAAVAARYVPIAVGTDTGGSIRVPAAFCGVVGLKPTYGRVPRHGVMPLSWTMDHVGPMTRSVADAARALAVMAGHDRRDPASSTAPVPRYDVDLSAGVRGLRVGLPASWFLDGCDPQVAAASRVAIEVLSGMGAEVVEVEVPSAALSEAVSWLIQMGERAAAHDGHLDRLHDFAPMNAVGLVTSHCISAGDYLRALRLRRVIQDELSAVFARVDVMVTPGPTCVAPQVSDFMAEIGTAKIPWLDVVTRNTRIFSMTGVPSLAVPAGFDSRGLPVGIQIVGAPHADALCLRVGHAYQQATAWHRARPPLLDGRRESVVVDRT